MHVSIKSYMHGELARRMNLIIRARSVRWGFKKLPRKHEQPLARETLARKGNRKGDRSLTGGLLPRALEISPQRPPAELKCSLTEGSAAKFENFPAKCRSSDHENAPITRRQDEVIIIIRNHSGGPPAALVQLIRNTLTSHCNRESYA